MKIKEINYGIGFTVVNNDKPLYIELNKNLRKYPRLRKQVLKHEMLHWNSRGWLDDFKIDFFDAFNISKQKSLSKFCRENKRAYLCNSPFFFEKGKIIPNYYMICIWSLIILGSIGIGGLII